MHAPGSPVDARSASPAGRTYSIVSTYPPTPCGVATFSAALSGGLQAGGAAVEIVRLGDDHVDPHGAEAERTLCDADVVIVQHEYGIYDGPDGDSVIGLLERLVRPSILVAHTVLRSPTAHQRVVLEEAADAADAVVVMTEAGRERLGEGYAIDRRKVTVIPHGAAVASAPTGAPRAWGPGSLLTWGLLGPGKGIEGAIDALALLRDVLPRPQYVIAGDTHPKVAALEGEAYREMLVERPAAGSPPRSTSIRATEDCRPWPTSCRRLPSSSCPTTHRTRSPPGCSSTRWRRGGPSSPPPFPTRSSPRQRRRSGRPSTGPGGARRRAPPSPHRARAGRRHGRRGATARTGPRLVGDRGAVRLARRRGVGDREALSA